MSHTRTHSDPPLPNLRRLPLIYLTDIEGLSAYITPACPPVDTTPPQRLMPPLPSHNLTKTPQTLA